MNIRSLVLFITSYYYGLWAHAYLWAKLYSLFCNFTGGKSILSIAFCLIQLLVAYAKNLSSIDCLIAAYKEKPTNIIFYIVKGGKQVVSKRF